MEQYTYYIDTEDGLHGFSHADVVYGLNNGTIDLNAKLLAYDNITRYKKEIKAKECLL